jgi:RNA-dependent RNA polymerase
MELELARIDYDADIYDVRKAVAEVLHGPDLYDPNHSDNKGRKPNFDIVMGKSPAGRIHNGRAALRLPARLGIKLHKWYRESEEHRIVVNGCPLRLFRTDNQVPLDVKQVLEKALYIDPDHDKLRTQIEERARSVRSRIAKVQFGVWYKQSPSDSPGTGSGRSFSVEYERDFLRNSAAYLYVVYEHKLFRIDVSATLRPNLFLIYLQSPIFRLASGRLKKQTIKFSSNSRVFENWALAMMNLDKHVSPHGHVIKPSRL